MCESSSSSSSSSSRDEYYLGGTIALLLQDHRMVGIQSATTQNRRGKKKETTAAEYNGLPYWGIITKCTTTQYHVSVLYYYSVIHVHHIIINSAVYAMAQCLSVVLQKWLNASAYNQCQMIV